MALLDVRNLKKVYTTRLGSNQVQALSNVNFSVEQGEYVAIMGESGSGKTNLGNVNLFMWCTLGTVLVFCVIYAIVFAITERAYYKIVSIGNK